jgi:hypothetical protein
MTTFLKSVRTAGRKGDAYDKALLMLFLLALGAGGLGPNGPEISQSELDSLLLGLAGILATFVSGNAAEHGLTKKTPTPPVQRADGEDPPTNA